ncbi:Gfo/Idh/MocA family protein [Alkalibacillus haloalkaliphilus]|uniref:Gfo/Idh/MocA family protein n=1 Tax=Alkalibacillus haloalkaliphilus TaxID=94136 RepID=UPI002936AEE2|nr:Gfo/Idh/MocA family oxidoreductase [Alkalibacillus haloalkaliphilus]MDV2581911.1 Gfo/Idh/MocA family oxidoreductase [Alkalibacillus haloalkaliphilus]
MGLKVGIVGCGSITRYRHAPEYYANPLVDEIVFFDRNRHRAESLAKEFEGTVANCFEDLINDETIDAISDCSSNEVHHVHTTKALLNGKHVLCEKPLAISSEHAKTILDAQTKSGKKLMVDHNQRFTKVHQKAREIILSGDYGDVLSFKTTFGHSGPEDWGVTKSNATWFFKKSRSHSGVVGDLGIHKIDLIHYLIDDEIEEVKSFVGSLDKVDENNKPIEVCDNAVCIFKTKKGRLGNGSFSWTYYGEEDNSTTIYLQKGILKIYHDPENQLIIEQPGGEKVKYELEHIQTNDNQTNTGVIDSFVDWIVSGVEPPVRGEDALSSLQIVEHIVND